MRGGPKIALVVLAGAGMAGAALFLSSGNAEPTGLTAPPIGFATSAAADPATAVETDGYGYLYDQGGASGSVTTTTAPGATTPTPASSAGREFELTEGSTAVFELDEELGGAPSQVVGTSDLVAGRLRLDPDDLSATEIGTIVVNARAFTTCQSLRDRAVRGVILDTDTFELVQFEPTAVHGLDGRAATGETRSFIVTGDLTVRDVTREVAVQVTATLVSPGRLEGSAQTTVLRSEFGIEIPSVLRVADVSDEVLLRLEFVATAG